MILRDVVAGLLIGLVNDGVGAVALVSIAWAVGVVVLFSHSARAFEEGMGETGWRTRARFHLMNFALSAAVAFIAGATVLWLR